MKNTPDILVQYNRPRHAVLCIELAGPLTRESERAALALAHRIAAAIIESDRPDRPLPGGLGRGRSVVS